MRRAGRAVDVTPIAIATNTRLRATIRLGAEKQPRMRNIAVAATAALIMCTPLAWTRAVGAAILTLQSCLCTVSGAAPKQNCQVMGRRRACLPIPEGSYRASAEFPEPDNHRIVQVGPQAPPAPSASLRAKGAPLRGRGPPVDYLDNPRDRDRTRPITRFSGKKLRIQAGIHTCSRSHTGASSRPVPSAW
jgi:hypothetical protein